MKSQDFGYDRRPSVVRSWYSQDRRTNGRGRTTVDIGCPFCTQVFTAHVWGLSGGGKKCPGCGALHTADGRAVPMAGRRLGG